MASPRILFTIIASTVLAACDPGGGADRSAEEGLRLGIAEYRGEATDDAAAFELLDADGLAIGAYRWSSDARGDHTVVDFGGRRYQLDVDLARTPTVTVDGEAIPLPGNDGSTELTADDRAALAQTLDLLSATHGDLGVGTAVGENDSFRVTCYYCWMLFEDYEICLEFEAPYCMIWPV